MKLHTNLTLHVTNFIPTVKYMRTLLILDLITKLLLSRRRVIDKTYYRLFSNVRSERIKFVKLQMFSYGRHFAFFSTPSQITK